MHLFGLISIPDWLIVFAVVTAFLYIYGTWTFRVWESQNVPSLPKYPFIGSLKELFTSPLADLDMRNLKTYGKTYGFYELRIPHLMIHDLEMIKTITIKDFNNFIDRRTVPLYGKSRLARHFLVHLTGDEWRSARAVLSPTFTSGKLRQMTGLMDECAQKMLKNLENDISQNNGEVNLKNQFNLFSMDVIASCCFSTNVNCKDPNDPFIQNAKNLFNFSTPIILVVIICPILAEIFELSLYPAKCLAHFEDVVHQIIHLRQSHNQKRNDFLQLLLDARNKEKEGKLLDGQEIDYSNNGEYAKDNWRSHKVLSESGVVANAILFLIAGFETISNTISFAVYELALNPDCQQKLHDEIDKTLKTHGELSHDVLLGLPYLDMVLSETLRKYPPSSRLERECASDYKLGDIFIPKGGLVSIGVHAIHHDHEIYPEPSKFDPERFTPENKSQRHPLVYLPFGAGPRGCIGTRFALMEMKIGLANFISQYKVSPCSKTEIPITMQKANVLLVPQNPIILKVELRTA